MTTLQTLLTLLRERTNMETSDFVTDQELTSYLNNSLCLLDGILITKFNDYKLTATVLKPTGDSLSLPSDFLKLRGLDVIIPNLTDGYHALSQFSFKQRNRYRTMGGLLYNAGHIQYRLQGNQILLIPSQIASQYQYRLWYVPDFVPLINTTDTLQPYMDSQAWYEYAICDSAIKVLEKQDLDTQVFERQSQELKEHIQKMSAPNRDAGDPVCVVDTRHHTGFNWFW